MLKKLRFDPPNENYYSNCPIKPGFWFWKEIVNSKKALKRLNIRIPDTLVVLGNNNFFHLQYNELKRGISIKTELDLSVLDFEKICLKKLDSRYKDKDYYLFV